MKPLVGSDVANLEWIQGESGVLKLKPTKTTATLNYYKYKLGKGSVLDKVWSLETHQRRRGKWN